LSLTLLSFLAKHLAKRFSIYPSEPQSVAHDGVFYTYPLGTLFTENMPLTCKAFLLLLFAILRHASLFGDDRRLYPISKIDLAHQILVLVSAHKTNEDMHHRETLDEIGQSLFTDNRHYKSPTPTQYLHGRR